MGTKVSGYFPLKTCIVICGHSLSWLCTYYFCKNINKPNLSGYLRGHVQQPKLSIIYKLALKMLFYRIIAIVVISIMLNLI